MHVTRHRQLTFYRPVFDNANKQKSIGTGTSFALRQSETLKHKTKRQTARESELDNKQTCEFFMTLSIRKNSAENITF